MLDKAVFFSDFDERKAVTFLQRFPSTRFGAKWGKTDAWGTEEWRVFGCSPLTFTAMSLPTGVRMQYYMSDAAMAKRGLSGLVEDGCLELTVDTGARWLGIGPATPAIRAKSSPGVESRGKQESVVWQRLLLDVTNPRRREQDLGKPVGAYPVAAKAKLERIDRIQATDSLWRRGYKY